MAEVGGQASVGTGRRHGAMNRAYFSKKPYRADESPRWLTAFARMADRSYVQ
jgi:hypothetical protein